MDKKSLESKLKRLKSKQNKLADPSRLDGKISYLEKLIGGQSGKRKRKNVSEEKAGKETESKSGAVEEEGGKSPESVGG